MSGIVAVFHLDGSPVDPAVVARMAQAAAHRGPEGTHCWVNGCLGLAHLALHATADGESEPQPLCLSGAGLCVVGDLRLDDRKELLAELQGSRYLEGESPADARLLLAAYCRWGERFVEHLEGDYAFVLWDAQKKQLLCARDALGVKPLHYARIGKALCIASEAQQILHHPGVAWRIDAVSMADHLINHCYDSQRTMFRDIRWLPPSGVLVANSTGVKLGSHRQMEPRRATRYRTERDYALHFLGLFERSVRERLRTHAPAVGLFMSGGLESTSIAAVAARQLAEQGGVPELIAHSYAFDHLQACDERIHSGVLARDRGLRVEYTPAERYPLLGDSEAFRPSLETPFMAWESVDHQMLGSLRQCGARVVLTGHAGRYSRLGDSTLVCCDRLMRGQGRVFRDLVRFARSEGIPAAVLLARWLIKPFLPSPLNAAIRRCASIQVAPGIPGWIDRGFARRTDLLDRVRMLRAHEPENLYQDLRRRNRPAQLVALGPVRRAVYWFDRAAARHGLEARHPLLDRRLMEFLLSIPPEQVHAPGSDRLVFRRAMEGILPEPLRRREGKTRFFPYFDYSLCRLEAARIRELLRRPVPGELGVVSPPELFQAFDSYCQGRISSSAGAMLWFPITLELWLREHGHRFQYQ